MLDDYTIALLTNVALLSLLAASAYLILLVGELSLGQQGFFAIGAYAAALATTTYDQPLALGVLFAIVAGSCAGGMLAAMSVHLSGFTFSLSTLAFAELVRTSLAAWEMERGPSGIDGFGNIRFAYDSGLGVSGFALVAISLCIGALAGIACLEASSIGRRWRAVGQDPELGYLLGLQPIKVKVAAMTLSGALAALAGALFAHALTFVEPNNFSVMLGIHVLAYVLIGGTGHVLGSLIGVTIDVVVLESLRELSSYRMIIFGGGVAVFLLFRPEGVLDVRTVHQMRNWRWHRGEKSRVTRQRPSP